MSFFQLVSAKSFHKSLIVFRLTKTGPLFIVTCFSFLPNLPVLIYNIMKTQENRGHSALVSENEQRVDTDRKTFIDVAASVDEYLKRVDWRVSANANQGYSLGGLILNVSGKVIANYWLDQVYAREIGEAHRAGDLHIHDLDMLSGYCAGWSLRTLLAEGFNGIPGKIEAKPPRHLSSAVGQMVNFLGTLQNEWAGAQAFSSTDSYLAPFVRKDNLSFKSVKQCIQELIYNLNVPSRWGCVPLDTEILTKSGWKSKEALSISDQVYGFQDGSIIDDDLLAINEYDFDGELIALSNHLQELLFTPNHRVLILDESNNQEHFFVNDAEALFQAEAHFSMPAAGHIVQEDYNISDDFIQLYALKQELPIHILRQCSERQIKRFIHLYRSGHTKKKHFHILIEDKQIVDGFQELAALVGYGTQVVEYKTTQGNTSYLITFVKKRFGPILFTSQKKVKYQGKVWCPTTRSSYWIARRQGCVFITGNSQTPFTNLTFDWVCPEDLRDQIPYIGGEEMPFSYGDLQPEMDMINRAFIEVMTEGDAKGRIFTFPLPTYNITSDFPWDSPNVDLLFEMTAKYGLPYFCLAEDTAILTDKGIKKIKEITLSDQVMGSDGQYKAVKNSFKTIQQSGIVITLKGLESICCSENHRFPTAQGLKRADALTLEDGLISTEGEVEIIDLERINQEMNMVDLEVDSQDHLFLLANTVLSHNSNFVNSDMTPNMVRSMCCRLRLDLTELLKRGNGLFGSSEQTGSLGILTLNCARLGYLYKGDEAGLYQRLDTLLELGRDSLEVKRAVIQEHMDNGLFPFTKRYLGTLRNHFSTLGVNGINEMIRNFTDDQEDITTEWGVSFAIRLLEYIRNRIVLFQEETGHMYNLEATPAEGTTYRFAKEDKKRFPDIIQAGTPERPYYTNSSQLPVGFTDDPFEALALQDELQILYTGGTVIHLYMNERISSAQACKTLVRRVLENYRLPYITVTPTFSICPVHGYLAGEHEFCPLCDQERINQKNNKRK